MDWVEKAAAMNLFGRIERKRVASNIIQLLLRSNGYCRVVFSLPLSVETYML